MSAGRHGSDVSDRHIDLFGSSVLQSSPILKTTGWTERDRERSLAMSFCRKLDVRMIEDERGHNGCGFSQRLSYVSQMYRCSRRSDILTATLGYQSTGSSRRDLSAQ